MHIQQLNHATLVRLMDLDARATLLAERAEQTSTRLAHVRDVVNGRTVLSSNPADIAKDATAARSELTVLLQQQPLHQRAADLEQRLLSTAKVWIEHLPNNSGLVSERPTPNGEQLPNIRERLIAIDKELTILKSAPIPSEDIAARVQQYVYHLASAAEPIITGVAANQTLKVVWPLGLGVNRQNQTNMSADTVNPLLLMAYLLRNELVCALMEQIKLEARVPLPIEHRPSQIARLTQERDSLLRLDAALVDEAWKMGATEVTNNPDLSAPALLFVRMK
jgi:hypothetical protein